MYVYGEGPARNALEKMVVEYGLSNRIFIRNSLPLKQIWRVMADATVGIVPKRADDFGNEAFSTKIFEFMAVGTPVIVAETKIDRYYFNENLVQFFRPGDAEDLAEKMLLILGNERRREELVANALSFASANSWSVKKEIYLNIVDELLRETR
jgi:glycosyltransferase involved in cell wall biosynthesis